MGWQEQGGTRGATNSDSEDEGAVQWGVNNYLLANPRLAEAPNDGDGTVEALTGADCSAPQARLDSNKPNSQRWSSEGRGIRNRAASDNDSGSVRSSTSVKTTLQKRKNKSGRQDNVLERHCHWSVSGVAGQGAQWAGARDEAPRYYGTGEQGQEVDGKQDDVRDDDEDANDPGTTYRRG